LTILDIDKATLHARIKHPVFPKDIKHQALILAEECGEVVQAVLNHTDHGEDYGNIRDELLDTAAVIVRMLEL
jgi:NTP pyrophosphatase (non-canonical NTP hydrolase)